MSHTSNDTYLDDLLERRGNWFSQFETNHDEKDVMEDEKGEYIVTCPQGSDCEHLIGLGEQGSGHEKVHLPKELQKDFIPF